MLLKFPLAIITADNIIYIYIHCCCTQVGCGGSYHTWAPLYPDPSTTDQFSLLISNRDLLLEFQLDRLFSRRIDYEKGT